MNAASTVLSLIIKLIVKLIKKIGINSVLGVFLFLEIVICIVYVAEVKDDDPNREERQIVSAQLMKVASNDPLLEEMEWISSDDRNYYILRVNVKNNYSQPITYLGVRVEDENEDFVMATKINYYGNEFAGYSLYECIPEGTEGYFDYLVMMYDFNVDECNQLTVYENDESKEAGVTVQIPK